MKVIIVDDDKPLLFILKKMISKIPGVEVAGIFRSAREASQFLSYNKVDMVFVDIKMPEQNGIDFAREAMLETKKVHLVFLTAYKEYALEAFNVCAFDYIVKPVSQEKLEHTINRARRLFSITPVHSTAPFPKLYAYGLGGLDIRDCNGEFVSFNSSKSLELLAYLMTHRGKSISKWKVIDDVFPGMPPPNAETYLNTTVYKLRKALEAHGQRSAVIVTSEGYRLETSEIYIDFIDFENSVSALNPGHETYLEAAIKAQELYAGELFGDKDYLWSLTEKERLLELYLNFAKKLGSYLFDNGNITLALRVFKKIVEKNELDDDVYCHLMEIYAMKKDIVSLVRHYERYVRVRHRELGIPPSRATTKLFFKLKESLV